MYQQPIIYTLAVWKVCLTDNYLQQIMLILTKAFVLNIFYENSISDITYLDNYQVK